MTKSRFDFLETPLSGFTLVKRKPILDERGFFCRFYCSEEFRKAGFSKSIVQINHTFTRKKGGIRGMHFQYPPHAETKIVTCLKGEIFDVAVDVREGSPTFLHWHGELLTAANQDALVVPEGFAHGFQAMTDHCEIIYLVTAPYALESEGRLNVADPRLGIKWPMEITDISDFDREQKFIDSSFRGVRL